ncbi:ankyrin repeat-containing protein [Pochonia chlamydosporia 170]|uniref:Ankyrin repeat-containing protein n=1 Tax=Pochonia chlamydosporia 170 TaxID=1380566 RepID=A0A179EZD1_METCM|nr:ankyrin repeat-containing protein [Pochonia chlamydosporia 170]OAQ58259.1 ankyrin repeat-containing protein [Pochonia chlamydosporia 170]
MAAPSRDAYQIGWICALPIEAAAAKQMLDEHFGTLDEQDSADTNSYTLGRVGRHYVVIACLPLGQYGTTSATAVATNMARTFSRSLRIGLMVGIGGGIPSADHDVRLGDIVVSRPDGTCGGVLQYDMGKVVEGGELRRTGSLNSPPRSLLTAVANMKKDAISDDPSYPEYIREAIQRNARTKQNFGRPDASTDRLFQTGRDHPMTEATCEACPSEWEETRTAREETDPQIHYGIIASGNAVMKHGATRQRLRRETGALCFEMEAAGLMQDFPCIVIRGICDYADSHKNKQWQGYAALAAASYAKELIGYVPVGRVSEEKLVTKICRVVDGLKEVHKSIEKTRLQQQSHHRENMLNLLSRDQQECHQAFKTSTYEQYKNINPNRADGTCRWILENSDYLAWQGSGHDDLLWISADPGCGKSVLAKSLVDIDLKTSSTLVSVCYFFFKDNDEQNNLATALCAVLHQLFGMQPSLLQHALPSWQKNGTKIQQEVDELWRILLAAVSDSASSNILCVFDALDECRPTDRAQLIGRLEKFYTQSHSSTRQNWLKFLVTSRPYAEIQDGFWPLTKSFPHIHIRGEDGNDQIREEISLVVRMRVAELSECLYLPPETQQRLEQQLLQMEHRTYLWLYLAMDDIRTMFQNSLQPEEESIDLIPGSVSDAYAKILNRVPPDKVSDVKIILQIIVGARRPLTIEEMAMALGIAKSFGSRTAAKAGLNPAGLDKKIRHLCGLFVFIKTSRVYLIHQTAREFLMSKNSRYNDREWSFKQGDTEQLMSEICINYLLLDDIGGNPRHKNGKVQSLLNYSAEYWPDHVRMMPSQAELKVENQLARLYDVTYGRL